MPIKNKKYILVLIFIIAILLMGLFAKDTAVAGFTPTDINVLLKNQFNTVNSAGLSGANVYSVVRMALLYILGLLGTLAVVSFVIAGIMYITAAGDEDRVGSAKKMLTYSVIGIVVALLGLVILVAVNTIING